MKLVINLPPTSWHTLFGSLLLAACSSAFAQSWATVDCQTLLQTGYPRPVWGSKERPSQEALLTLINYQLAISICQQDELIRLQKEKSPKTNELPKAKLGPITALPKESTKDKDADAATAPATNPATNPSLKAEN